MICRYLDVKHVLIMLLLKIVILIFSLEYEQQVHVVLLRLRRMIICYSGLMRYDELIRLFEIVAGKIDLKMVFILIFLKNLVRLI